MRIPIDRTVQCAIFAVALAVTGCRSAQDKANDAALAQAKQQATTTGSAQQIVWTDKDGSTVTTVVQPPAPGQTTQQITTTRTSHTSASTTATTPAPPQTAMVPGAPGYATPAPEPVSSGPVITPIDVHVPRGTTLAIRINQHISVKTSRAGDHFSGEVVHDIPASDSNRIAIPRGTRVNGIVDASHRRGHFKGRSILELRLTSMELNGERYDLDTHDNVRTKKGKGKRSAAFIGGGTGLGMLVGGVASGGVGLVVGGLAGAGGGTLLGGLTGNRDIEIPAESVMNFRLADDLVVQPPA